MPLWDDTKLFDRLKQLLEQRKKGYVKFNKARESIINLMRPDLNPDIDTDNDGDGSFFGEDIYDGVGSWSIGVMARGFQGGLVSADTDWIAHQMGMTELRDVDELDIWLQEIKEHMTNAYQLSNFYKVLPNFTKDGLSIGSPLMFVEETDIITGEVTFLPQHFQTVFIFYGKDNKPEGVIIEDEKWTVKQITDKFAPTTEQQKEKLSTSINNAIETGTIYKEHKILRGVFKSDNPLWEGIEGFDKPDGEWISIYFEEKTAEDRKNDPLLVERYFSRPFVVLDIDKKPWESVSRTPAFSAVHDVLSQQEMGLDQAENRKLKNRPPMVVNEDHRNIVDFNPEGITAIPAGDFLTLPRSIDMVGDLRLTREEMEFQAEKVKRWFKTDQFLKFTDLTNTLRQQPSATQIIKIAAELATQVSPEIAGYTGMLADVDDRMINIEIRAGRGPFSPDRMLDIGNIIVNNLAEGRVITTFTITPKFTGPLARAQQVKQELDPILEGLGASALLFELFPDLKTAIREYGTLEKILKATGFPLTELKPEEQYDEIVAALNEARAQQEQQAFALEAAKVSKNLQGPVDETSVLAQAGEAG